jgi:hypothetical protein
MSARFNKRKIFLLAMIMLFLTFGICRYWDILSYRFISDPRGSGRSEFYSAIFEGWQRADLQNLLFGFGFYEVPDYLERVHGATIYAHSDWLELLYDHGLFGVSIYLMLIGSTLSYIRSVKSVRPDLLPLFIMIMTFWILRSIVSGVYINKDSMILFALLGFLLGQVYRNRDNYPMGRSRTFAITAHSKNILKPHNRQCL